MVATFVGSRRRRATEGLDPAPRGFVFPTLPLAAAEPSHREMKVLRGVAEGLTNDQIAYRLGISPRTVATHLRRMAAQHQTQGRTALLMLAPQRGWIVRLPEGMDAAPGAALCGQDRRLADPPDPSDH